MYLASILVISIEMASVIVLSSVLTLALLVTLIIVVFIMSSMMLTRSKRKAYIYLESMTTRDDLVVELRCYKDGKGYTYRCTPYQALNWLANGYMFIWLRTF